MELRKLRYFEAVASAASFRRAAEKLHVAHTALSKQISLLEEELGCVLLLRTTRQVRLTTAGETFLGHVRQILRDVDFAVRQARLAGAGHLGGIRIGFRETAGRSPSVAQLFAGFNSAYPGVEVQLEQCNTVAQCEALLKGSLDIGIMYAPPPEYGAFSTLTLAEETIFLALSQAHRLAAAERIVLQDLSDEAFIGFRRSEGSYYANLFTAILANAGVVPRTVTEVDSEAATLNLVSVAMGVGMAVASSSADAPPGVVFKRIEGFDQVMKLELVWVEETLTPIARNFIAIAHQVMAAG